MVRPEAPGNGAISILEDVQWFTQQIQDCQAGMYRLAMSILCSEEDAADAAQDAILIAYQKLSTLRDRSRFRPWLLRILTHQCYAILRQRKQVVPFDSLPEQEAPSPSSSSEELWQAVCDLSEQLRSVVVLYYYEGFSARETGEILGISEANVKTRLSRARKRLREQLEASQ